MTPYVEGRKARVHPVHARPRSTTTGKIWGVPRVTDAGFLYYRTDQVDEVPDDLAGRLQAGRRARSGIVYQGAAYEGLTVDFLELAFAAGGKVLSDDGKKSEINSPANVKALQFMVDGIKNGAAPKAVTTYMEEQARRAFEAGRATFMRNWPYAYALGNEAPQGQGQVRGRAVPGVRGRRQGRHPRRPQPRDLGVLEEPRGRGRAHRLPDLARGHEARRGRVLAGPGRSAATYDDAEVKKALPFATSSSRRSSRRKSRPVSPVYTPDLAGDLQERQRRRCRASSRRRPRSRRRTSEITKALATF